MTVNAELNKKHTAAHIIGNMPDKNINHTNSGMEILPLGQSHQKKESPILTVYNLVPAYVSHHTIYSVGTELSVIVQHQDILK